MTESSSTPEPIDCREVPVGLDTDVFSAGVNGGPPPHAARSMSRVCRSWNERPLTVAGNRDVRKSRRSA